MKLVSAWLRKHALFQFLFFVLLTILFFVILLHFVDARLVLKTLSQANPLYVFCAFLIVFSYPTFIAWRWQFLLKNLGYGLPFWECLRIVLGTWPIMSVTPLKSGDLLKGFYIKDKVPVVTATGSIMTEKILDLSSLIVLSIIGSLELGQYQVLPITLGILGCLVIAPLVLRFAKLPLTDTFKAKLDSLLLSIRSLVKKPRQLVFIFLFSIVKWILVIGQAALCFLAFGVSVPFSYVIAALPIAIFVGLLPISISGMGTRDAAIMYLFSQYAPPDVCLSVGLLYSFFGYWLLSLIGLPFLNANWRR